MNWIFSRLLFGYLLLDTPLWGEAVKPQLLIWGGRAMPSPLEIIRIGPSDRKSIYGI